MRKFQPSLLLLALLVMAGGCATKKAVTDNPAASTTTGPHAIDEKKLGIGSPQTATAEPAIIGQLKAGEMKADNIVAGLTFNVKTDKKDITLPGSLHMRRGETIRIQLFIPIIRSEVGRLEFTPDYVLVIDRMHKEYIQADYNQIDFLRDNGIDFNALQSLFWNQFYMPGEAGFSAVKAEDGAGETVLLSATKGKFAYSWTANRRTAKIKQTAVRYTSATKGTSSLTWQYDQFQGVGGKLFPAWQCFQFSLPKSGAAKTTSVTLDLDDLSTDGKWDARTTVSPKYKKVETDDILSKITNL